MYWDLVWGSRDTTACRELKGLWGRERHKSVTKVKCECFRSNLMGHFCAPSELIMMVSYEVTVDCTCILQEAILLHQSHSLTSGLREKALFAQYTATKSWHSYPFLWWCLLDLFVVDRPHTLRDLYSYVWGQVDSSNKHLGSSPCGLCSSTLTLFLKCWRWLSKSVRRKMMCLADIAAFTVSYWWKLLIAWL